MPCSRLELYKGPASECVTQGVVLHRAPNAPWLFLFASSCESKGNNECKSHEPLGHRLELQVFPPLGWVKHLLPLGPAESGWIELVVNLFRASNSSSSSSSASSSSPSPSPSSSLPLLDQHRKHRFQQRIQGEQSVRRWTRAELVTVTQWKHASATIQQSYVGLA